MLLPVVPVDAAATHHCNMAVAAVTVQQLHRARAAMAARYGGVARSLAGAAAVSAEV
jgi:hypothetical protein